MEVYKIRVTKNPEERRRELIDIAENLFIKKGYEATAVSDIVTKAQVAQGTFYYYFKSKEAVLDAITDRYIDYTIKGMKDIAQQQHLTAIEKLVEIFLFGTSFRENRKSIMQYLHEDRNAHLHLKFEKKLPSGIGDSLTRIITQGVGEGVFNTNYPEDAAKAFIGITAMVLKGIDKAEPTSQEFKRKFMATFDFLERILGTEKDSILTVYRKKGGSFIDKK